MSFIFLETLITKVTPHPHTYAFFFFFWTSDVEWGNHISQFQACFICSVQGQLDLEEFPVCYWFPILISCSSHRAPLWVCLRGFEYVPLEHHQGTRPTTGHPGRAWPDSDFEPSSGQPGSSLVSCSSSLSEATLCWPLPPREWPVLGLEVSGPSQGTDIVSLSISLPFPTHIPNFTSLDF